MDKNCSFVPKNVHLVPKKQKICSFNTKNEVFAKTFDQNVQILDKNCSSVPKNVHLVQKKQKFVLFTLKMKLLPKNLYTFWIKTLVLYPKMYLWSRKNKKIVLFTLKMKFMPKNFTKMYKFCIKNCSFVPKNVHLGPKKQNICTFYTKNEIFAKTFY